MNGKRAKAIRRLVNHKVNDPRRYDLVRQEDAVTSQMLGTTRTKVSTGTRRDYRIAKKFFNGEDVIIPNHLQGILK